MDEPNESRDRTDAPDRTESPGPEEGEGAGDPERTRSGDGQYGPADDTYDPETVESTVSDVEGVEYGGGNVAGASPTSDLGPVEPETPTLEGALFVLLGVVLTLVVLAQLVGF